MAALQPPPSRTRRDLHRHSPMLLSHSVFLSLFAPICAHINKGSRERGKTTNGRMTQGWGLADEFTTRPNRTCNRAPKGALLPAIPALPLTCTPPPRRKSPNKLEPISLAFLENPIGPPRPRASARQKQNLKIPKFQESSKLNATSPK